MTKMNGANYLAAIKQYGNISHAAKALYISQPYLSKFIKELEQDIGVILVNRNTSPLTLTYAGERYLHYMKQIADIYKNMENEIQTLSKLKKGQLYIGVNPILATHTLYNILPEFTKRYPGVEIKLIEESAHRIEQLLIDNKVDIALTILPLYQENIAYDVLYTEKIYMALPPNHSLTYKSDADLLDSITIFEYLNNAKFILLKPEMALRKVTDQILKDYDVKPNITMETLSVENALKLANEGLGITFVPESVKNKNEHNNCKFIALDSFKYYNQVVIAYGKDDKTQLSEAAKALLSMAQNNYYR